MTDPAPNAGPAAPPGEAAPAPPWRDDPPLPPNARLPEDSYGYPLPNRRSAHCTRKGLVRLLRKEPRTEAVYVPESRIPGVEPATYAPVRPEDAGLMEDVRRALVRRTILTTALVGVLAAGAAVWAVASWNEAGIRSLPGFLTVFLGAGTVLGMYDVRRTRRVDEGMFPRARQGYRHWTWARGHDAPFVWTLVFTLGLVALLTFSTEDAVRGAGLVKPAVWDGELWRMLTGPTLHANFTHAWMNLSGLFVLGYLVEAHTTRYHLSTVFLVSALGGSILSVLLSDTSSVGASGGVMGLVGFLWMLARLRPREVPDDFGGRMKYAVGATAVLGVIGLQFIDNWAHLGGLLAGAGMGWLMLREDAPLRGRRRVTAVGIVSLLILLGSMAGAVAGTWSVMNAEFSAPPPRP